MSTSRATQLSIEPAPAILEEQTSVPLTYNLLPDAEVIKAIIKLYATAKQVKANNSIFWKFVETGVSIFSATMETNRSANEKLLEGLNNQTKNLDDVNAWLDYTYCLGDAGQKMQKTKKKTTTLSLSCRITFFILGYVRNHLYQHFPFEVENKIQNLYEQIATKKREIKRIQTELEQLPHQYFDKIKNKQIQKLRTEIDEILLRLTYLGDKKGCQKAIRAKLLETLHIETRDISIPYCLSEKFYTEFYEQRLRFLTANNLNDFIRVESSKTPKKAISQTAPSTIITPASTMSTQQITQRLSVELPTSNQAPDAQTKQPQLNLKGSAENALVDTKVDETQNKQPQSNPTVPPGNPSIDLAASAAQQSSATQHSQGDQASSATKGRNAGKRKGKQTNTPTENASNTSSSETPSMKRK